MTPLRNVLTEAGKLLDPEMERELPPGTEILLRLHGAGGLMVAITEPEHPPGETPGQTRLGEAPPAESP